MNQKKYSELCKRVENKNIVAWYLKTEELFKNQEITREDDFIKLVAFAYSWMPTIPKWRQDLNWMACKEALMKLKCGEPGALKEVLQLIVPSINNSIVGASKVLHFACPDQAPIIDHNVVVGWRTLFFPTGVYGKNNGDIAALPSNFGAYGSDNIKRQKHIDLYIKYSENLNAWSQLLIDVSARDIEEKLYLLGKQITDEAKKVNKAN